jgi:hypothetical protein
MKTKRADEWIRILGAGKLAFGSDVNGGSYLGKARVSAHVLLTGKALSIPQNEWTCKYRLDWYSDGKKPKGPGAIFRPNGVVSFTDVPVRSLLYGDAKQNKANAIRLMQFAKRAIMQNEGFDRR